MEYLNANPVTAGVDNTQIQVAYQQIQPLLENDQPHSALTELLHMAEKFPLSAQIQNDLGVLYYQVGDMEKAFDHYRKAADLGPENMTFQKNLADFYLVQQGDIEQALSIYNRILSQNPTDIETLQVIGQICLSLEKFEDAAVFFNKVLDLEPWNQTAWKALEALTPPVSEGSALPQSESPAPSFEHIEECLKMGDIEGALEGLETMVRASPDNARAFNDLGVLHFQQGNKAKSLYYYQKAVELDPHNPSYQKNLADFLLIELDQTEEALKLYIEVLKKHPEDTETLFALGHICVQLGKLTDARLFYDRIMDIEPWNLNAQEMLDALTSNGKPGAIGS
ncbi:MAG: tetratricopeptide repeat protein [Thermodesulfobacteriota bacterium]